MKKKKEKEDLILHLECDADEALAKYIGFTRKTINHHKGKTRVVKELEKGNLCIALIDEDPDGVVPDYLTTCKRIGEQNGVVHFEHTKNKQQIFMVCPQLEGWIIRIAKESKVSLSKFGLPEKFEELHQTLHRKPEAFQKLLDELVTKNNKSLKHLTDLLQSRK